MKSLKFLSAILFIFTLVIGSSLDANAQRKSPPKELKAEMDGLSLTINYHSPSVRDREIWGALVPYDEVWRTGANQATTLQINQDVLLEGQHLSAGTYTIYTIPSKEKWVFIINGQTGQWGTVYDKEQDVIRIEASPQETDEFAEMMSFNMKSKDGKGKVVLHWANLAVGFKIEPAPMK